MRIPRNPYNIQIYQKSKKTQRFWLSIFGIMLLLILSVWLCGCVSSEKITARYESAVETYDRLADIAWEYAARETTPIEHRRIINRVLTAAEEAIEAANEKKISVAKGIFAIQKSIDELRDVMENFIGKEKS